MRNTTWAEGSETGILERELVGSIRKRRKGGRPKHTRRHVESRSAPKIRRDGIHGSQAKVSQLDRPTLIRHQDVLRLQIPVVDSNRMAEIDGIQDLNKNALHQGVIPDEVALVGDAGEQIPLGTELDHHIDAVCRVHDRFEGHNVRMLTGHVVQFNFALLVFKLAGVESSLVEGLHGIHDVRMDIDGSVDDAIGPDAQDSRKFQSVGQ